MEDKKVIYETETVQDQLKKMTQADWTEQSVQEYLNCVLCGSEYTFYHKTDFTFMTVDEEAHCPLCNVRGSKHQHLLQ